MKKQIAPIKVKMVAQVARFAKIGSGRTNAMKAEIRKDTHPMKLMIVIHQEIVRRSHCWRSRHFRSKAMPPSMAASLEPVVEAPIVLAASGAFHRSASICTQPASNSAVCGYSSLSIMFLSMVRSVTPSLYRLSFRLVPVYPHNGSTMGYFE